MTVVSRFWRAMYRRYAEWRFDRAMTRSEPAELVMPGVFGAALVQEGVRTWATGSGQTWTFDATAGARRVS